MLASSGSTASQVIIAVSVFLPVIVAIWLAWIFLRGKKDDPDEQRWRRLEEQRRAAERDDR